MTTENDNLVIQSLGRIEGKLDKINGRVRALEIWRAKLIGAYIAISIVVSAGVSILISVLH